MTTTTSPGALEQVVNGAKLVADFTVLPGSSLLVDGKILEGGAHTLVGLVAARAIGPLGWILVAANSYSKSVSGTSLYGHLSGLVSSKTGTKSVEAAPATIEVA